MDQLRASNSSKVTVEYTDPSGVFHLVSDGLQRNLPLRNLHWNSSSRPLRSISSLHIELVPAGGHVSQNSFPYPPLEDAVQTTAGNASQPGTRPPQGAESRKERRHQIPGLRQTPYLKIYLLRCDDTETYKSVSRRLLRDWVKEHTPPSQSSVSVNKGENHDAFEWLIIHVLPPIGDPSNGAVDSRSPKDDVRGDRGSNTTRWSNRGSSKVIEKIRADFNGTSKAAIDRVAQIQVGEDLGTSSVTHPSNSFSDPQSMGDKKGWNDLISKLKFLILASFDLRVSQYEEDIKEKDSQRNLPGWNFNTFFVLKEGLARGFESVGLIEDALLSYHELAAALNNIVGEQYTHSSTERQTGLFREFTDDLREELIQAVSVLQGDLQSHENISRNSHDFGALILDTDRKPYRELILANNISAFDFVCYVFARKMILLLRLSNVPDSSFDTRTGDSEPNKSNMYIKSSGPRPTPIEEEAENLLVLSDLCRQAVEFITFVARTIRIDLRSSIEDLARTNKAIGSLPETIQNDIIENLVASWIFSTSECVLRKTLTDSLSTKLQPLMSQFKPHNDKHESYFEDYISTSEVIKIQELPPRTSSLQSRTSALDKSFAQDKFPSVTMPDAIRLLPPGSSQTGSPELAAQRAELTSLARSTLGILGLRNHLWNGCWSDLDSIQSFDIDMDEVSLEDTVKDDRDGLEKSSKISQASSTSGIHNQALRLALKSKSDFYAAYENLTASILALYVLCDRQKSAQAMTAEIAAIRFHTGDYKAAASYFHQLAPFYAKDDWDSLEMSILNMYAQCLKNISRHEEYVRVGLKMVAKLVRQNKSPFRVQPNAAHKPLSLSNLVSASRSLKEPITVPLDKYFRIITVDPYLRHYDDHDGFQLQLKLWNGTLGAMEAQQIQVQISSIEAEIHAEIWLTSDNPHVLEPGTVTILIGTKIMIPAWYMLNKIMLRSENIIFTQDLSLSLHSSPFPAGSRRSGSRASVNINQTRILVWPLTEALEACLALCNKIHLEQPRSVEIEVNTGWNHISRGIVLLRAGSAGLRLRTADALLTSGNTAILDQSQPGSIGFGELSADAAMVLRIPYDLESDLKEITVKIEVMYTTAKGDFTYACNPRIPTLLPLGVNVQDIFQQDALVSKFTISTPNSVPLCVTRCYVQDSPDFEVSSPSLATERLDVYARQPLSVISRIRKKQKKGSTPEAKSPGPARLLLEIEYRCLDREIYETLKQSFAKPLATSKLRDLTRLLVPALLEKQRSKMSIQDLEMIGLRREIPLNIVVENDWNTVLAGIDLDRRHEVAQWLMDWQEKHTTISIQEDMQTSKLQYLTVPVDIPQMEVVHTASLKLHLDHLKVSPELDYVAVGQPIPAELVIKHTRRWLTETEPQPSKEPLDFCYEVQANSDIWLIGGQRKAHFRAQEDELQRFPLLLIPQKPGHLLYPSLDITTTSPSSGSKDSNKDHGALDNAFHSSETDYRSQGETLLVVSDISSTTVSIDPGNQASGTWLVDCKAPPRV